MPSDIAFLAPLGISRTALARAAAQSSRERMPAADCLLASGAVSELLYYKALADHLALPFVQAGIRPAAAADARRSIETGAVRLDARAAARWLIAPRGHWIPTLVTARRIGISLNDFCITTPTRLSAVVRHAARDAIAGQARDGLWARDPTLSAKTVGSLWLKLGMAAGLLVLVVSAAAVPRLVGDVFGVLFFVGLAFRLLISAHGLGPPEPEPEPLEDGALPFYSVLVPLHREANMVRQLVDALDRLDYPRSRLEVKLLLEAHDIETQLACYSAALAPHYEIIVAPRDRLLTKPRALNVALPFIRGTLVTVYDAEDRPDRDQLRRAAARFRDSPKTLACLQARLAIDAGGSLLSRLFRLDYAVLFGLFNPGLARAALPVPLGGSSNHFRLEALRAIGGWDAWNVTEDADLGLRLARAGYRTAMLDSTTWEEAPASLATWMGQRRRWMKGWMQTAIVLARRPRRLQAELGPRRAIAALLLLISLVLGPLGLLPSAALVLASLAPGLLPIQGHPTLAEVTLWTSVFAGGSFALVWSAAMAARARGFRVTLGDFAALWPYQLLIGVAALSAAAALVWRPHHWQKTPHGVTRPPVGRASAAPKQDEATAPATARRAQLFLTRALRAA